MPFSYPGYHNRIVVFLVVKKNLVNARQAQGSFPPLRPQQSAQARSHSEAQAFQASGSRCGARVGGIVYNVFTVEYVL